jgi:amyloid beta precursor protein binding protein 1
LFLSTTIRQCSPEPQFFKQFSLIITANLPQRQLAPLASLCWSEGISLLVVKSYGFLGSVRLQLNGHNIIESKTEGDHFDLRIAEPFPELEQYCEGINMEEMDSLQHGHVPYIAILYKAIRTWRAQVILFDCPALRHEAFWSVSLQFLLACSIVSRMLKCVCLISSF